jgi:hypothetical protein
MRSTPGTFAITGLLALFGSACMTSTSSSPPGPAMVTITVANATTGLTSGGDDALFTLTLASASKSYALTDIVVSVSDPGKTETAVNFNLDDKDGNGKLDQGESLHCVEPGLNLFDATNVGKSLGVHFAETVSGTTYQTGSATWAPSN